LVRRRDGKWFLLVIVDLPNGAPTPTTDFIGVDFGVINIAIGGDAHPQRRAPAGGVDDRRTRRIVALVAPRNTEQEVTL
jgi:transposase